MKTTVAALMAMLVGGLVGCSSSDETGRDEQGMYGDEDTAMSRGGPRDDWTRLQEDPVWGRTVSPKSAVVEEYDDQSYYFHDGDCAKKFKENPHAFLPGADERDRDRMAKDPVCGHEVNPMTAQFTEEYDHKKYYFDTKECAQKFKDNPHAYMPGGDDRPGIKEVR
ncbi:MAG: YHS domain-containing protein [Planctomycetota bacterium]|nr:MAG: YHS domain-containing protein [Planctomycetota bacterium]